MAAFLDRFAILQQNSWNGRKIYSAKERASGQVVYLVAESGRGSLDPYRHPGLPALSQAAVEEQVRWLAGPAPAGHTLEDLWGQGALTGKEVVAMLLAVLDGLTALARLEPPLVPGYLDPAVIRRDPAGRWTLDYLALAHSPEARASGGAPIGVYPMGTLLYWLATGQAGRRTRAHVVKLDPGVPSQLQFMIIRSMGRSYPSLAEVRVALERAGSGQDFATLLSRRAALKAPGKAELPERQGAREVASGSELAEGRPPAEGARQWALPVRPEEGFRTYVVPPPPDPYIQRRARWLAGGLAAAVVGMVALAIGLGLRERAPNRLPGLGTPSGQIGPGLPPEPPLSDEPFAGGPPPAPGPIDLKDQAIGGKPTLVLIDGEEAGWVYGWKMAQEYWVSLEAYNRVSGQNLYWTQGVGGSLRLYDGTGRSFVTYDFDLIGGRVWLQLTLDLQHDLRVLIDDTTPGIIRITRTP